MARVHFVKAAAKDHPRYGIKKGESYYWWKFRTGGYGGAKHVSKTQPRQSQLTQSEFLSSVYAALEKIEDAGAGDDFESLVADVVSDLESAKDENEDRFSNMPDSLQSSPTGDMMQERTSSVEELIDELQNVDIEVADPDDEDVKDKVGDKEEDETDDEYQDRLNDAKEEMLDERRQEILDELQGITYNGE